MNRTDTILALERKRLRIVNRYALATEQDCVLTHIPHHGCVCNGCQSDRMIRLTCAIDGAIQRLGK